MRRLFLLVLLAFLPLQSIWAAAAGYCSHEQAPAAVHFGHHGHPHHGAAADTDGAHGGGTPGKIAQVGADLDCHSCHGSANAPHQQADATPLRLGAHLPAAPLLPPLRAPAPLRPERPNWHRLA
ncbi:MAG: hypothetical protein LWW82_06810 [Comamonadaceae bacterium]|nr:hypothetical protein [Comamonadaceae bacterium]